MFFCTSSHAFPWLQIHTRCEKAPGIFTYVYRTWEPLSRKACIAWYAVHLNKDPAISYQLQRAGDCLRPTSFGSLTFLVTCLWAVLELWNAVVNKQPRHGCYCLLCVASKANVDNMSVQGNFRCPGNKINTVVMWLIFFPQLKHVVRALMFVVCLYLFPNKLILKEIEFIPVDRHRISKNRNLFDSSPGIVWDSSCQPFYVSYPFIKEDHQIYPQYAHWCLFLKNTTLTNP